ncbi:MAG: flavin reductase family protein [Trueperaceae bacterium]
MMTSIDPRLFRDVLGRFATGVTVVTVRVPHDDRSVRAAGAAAAGVPAAGAPVAGAPTVGAPAAGAGAPSRGEAVPATVHGMTVNAFMSVSLEPPLVAVGIDRNAKSHAALLAADRFGISVLGLDQRGLSDQFAGRPVPQQPDPFVLLDGFPVVDGALAQVVCRRWRAMEAGDHTIFVGEIEALQHRVGDPLLFFGGRYRALGSVETVG